MVLVLAGCAAGDSSEDVAAGGTTVSNCGIDVTVDGPPERVYAAYQPAIEIAHALGISDRLVETAFLDAQVLPDYAEAQDHAAYVERLPSREALLATGPDFVLSGYNNVFTEDGAGDTSFGTRAGLAEVGIQSWILSPLCPSADGLSDEAIDPATVRVDTIFDDLRDFGTLFGVEERAEEIIADQRTRIEAVGTAVAGAPRPSVAIVLLDEGGGIRVAGGVDFGTQIIEHAGGVNAFEDLTERRHVEIDLEELMRRDPDVILTSTCCDASYTREDGAEEVRSIVENPALAGVAAVRDDAVYPFLFADRAAGVRAAHAIELLASLLHPDLVEPGQVGSGTE
ncbi:ABC transporter substrate-binding protein [Jiangella endophytica]|uniref:ABC transporter substrate-binding protein n=1 Tax=Jiangella endophytica TaxID=1623398 RepID=UPI0018E551C9|nr:ABC transporter substrate-binding protein [Jiangella endophytica]